MLDCPCSGDTRNGHCRLFLKTAGRSLGAERACGYPACPASGGLPRKGLLAGDDLNDFVAGADVEPALLAQLFRRVNAQFILLRNAKESASPPSLKALLPAGRVRRQGLKPLLVGAIAARLKSCLDGLPSAGAL